MTNTNGKVIVAPLVAEALETIVRECPPEEVVEMYFNDALYYYPELRELHLDTLIRALYIGYEVEKTPEEELADYIRNCDWHMEQAQIEPLRSFWKYEAAGARKAAEILGVKLPEPTERTDAN